MSSGKGRRNTVTRDDLIKVLVISGLSGVVAAFSGASPTGSAPTDAIILFGYALLVGWLGATAPWWALGAAAGIVMVASVGGPILLVAIGILAVAGALWIGSERTSLSPLRSLIAAAVVQLSLRLEWDPFFLASAFIAAVAVGLVAITGWQRRRGYVRKRVLWGLAGAGVAVIVVLAGFGFGAAKSRSAASAGYQELLRGLDLMHSGDLSGATTALRSAATNLESAAGDLDSPITQPARLVPVVAQNRNAVVDILDNASAAATSAADALAVVDFDQLTVTNGVVDVDALEVLAPSLADLEDTVTGLAAALEDAESPWLLPPLQNRLDHALERADQVEQQAKGISATARLAPTMLGADGPRRYLFLFTNSAEARGTNGLMGNWSELTIDDGRLAVTATGRTAELINPLRDQDVQLDMPDEFFIRYGPFGAGTADGGTYPKFWSNVTMPPDMPTVGSASAQMYEQATGRGVDGVFVVDAAGLAALLQVTGPIEVEGLDFPLTSENAEQFLLVDQYEFVESERRDLLAAVTEATMQTVLSSTLPAPQQLAQALGPAAVGGHISAWAARPEDQELFSIVGMDNALPSLVDETAVRDGLAVVTDNSSGNKIDSFLQRTITYTAEHDLADGSIESTLEIVLTNNAPTSGYPDYVIGNIAGLPNGTNQTILTVYSPQRVTTMTVDGEPLSWTTTTELGWITSSANLILPPGGSRTVVVTMTGAVGAPYELVYRPQALPNPDVLTVDVKSSDDHITYDGTPERRIVISEDGQTAWRAA